MRSSRNGWRFIVGRITGGNPGRGANRTVVMRRMTLTFDERYSGIIVLIESW